MTELYTWRTDPGMTLATAARPSGASVTKWIYDDATGLLMEKQESVEADAIPYVPGKGPGYEYDTAGRLFQRTDARGVVPDYDYTVWGQLEAVDYSIATEATPNLDYVYDRLGRTTLVTQGAATKHDFSYDSSTLALDAEIIDYDLDRDGTVDLVREMNYHRDTYLRSTGYEFGTEGFTTAALSAGYGFDSVGRMDSVWHGPTFTSGVPNGTADFTYSYRYTVSGSLHVGVAHHFDIGLRFQIDVG